MSNKVGIWIDHKKAIMLFIDGTSEESKTVTADGGSGMDGNAAKADDIQQRIETSGHNAFYDDVITAVGDADPIYIFGPAEAKGELQKRMEKTITGDRSITTETADSMTDNQVAAQIRDHFAPANS
ncbi:MAG: hypothetical protein ABJA02_07745 [Acidobacteriota bacterium]